MKVFYCNDHDGYYMPGVSIIVAENEERARAVLSKELKIRGLSDSKFTLCEVDTGTELAEVLFNGDY